MLNGSWSWSDNGISGWTNGTGENKRSSLSASTAINNNLAIGATAKRALLRVCAMDRDSSRANRGKKLARMRFLTRRTLRTPRVRTIVESVRNGTTFTFTSRPLIYFLRGQPLHQESNNLSFQRIEKRIRSVKHSGYVWVRFALREISFLDSSRISGEIFSNVWIF